MKLSVVAIAVLSAFVATPVTGEIDSFDFKLKNHEFIVDKAGSSVLLTSRHSRVLAFVAILGLPLALILSHMEMFKTALMVVLLVSISIAVFA